jgi:ribosomal protein S13
MSSHESVQVTAVGENKPAASSNESRKRGGRNNALKHGAYAESLVLPGESIDDFNLLHRGLIDEWKPTGTSEEDTVLTLAQCFWAKRRVDYFYNREVLGGQYQDEDVIRHVNYIMELLDGAQTAAEAAIQIAHLPADYQTWIAQEVPRSNFQDEKSWIESLKSKLLSYLEAHVKFANATRSMPYKVNKATFMRELTAKKIALDERLDARIDKAIKRLAQIKAIKPILEERDSHIRGIRSISDQRQKTSTP